MSSAVRFAHVQRRVELDQVQRAQATGVGDHLHAQLGLAVGRAAAHRGAHARRNVRVEEIDIEAHVQVGAGSISASANSIVWRMPISSM